MLKVILFIFLAVILTGTGLYFYTRMAAPLAPAPTTTVMTETTPTPSAGEPIAGVNYLEYSPDNFAKAADKKRVIFFYAAWCPTCRPADAEFKQRIQEIPDDVVVLRANYDTESALKKQYGITYQHTFVLVDENGNAITKWNGGAVDELIKNTQ